VVTARQIAADLCGRPNSTSWLASRAWSSLSARKVGINNTIQVQPATIDYDAAAIIRLLSLAAGGGQQRLPHIVQRYQNDPAAVLLTAVVDGNIVGVVGYLVSAAEVILLHIATAPPLRRAGIGTRLLAAVRHAIPAGLPIVAETDKDAVGFYTANNFVVTSLGEKYPGVERFHVKAWRENDESDDENRDHHRC
jgi:ribosomal protein S18 acetylase RimI-like enzyme